MSALSTINARFREQVLPVLPAPVRGLLEGGSRKQLLAKANQRLLLIDHELIDLSTGISQTISDQTREFSPAAIAQTARQLLNSDSVGGVALYLPPSEFVATTINMPGVSKENLISALKLQADNLFPSFEQELELTLANKVSDPDANTIALWFPQHTTNELFNAFENVGLFLVALAPRNLVAVEQSAVVDFDQQGGTLAQFSEGVLSSWLHINQQDLNDDKLDQQWHSAMAECQSEQVQTFEGPNTFKNFDSSPLPVDYCFIPAGALQARRRVEKGRNIGLAGAALAIVLLLGAVPFISQSLQFRSLAATLESHRVQSADARRDQSIVVNFENEWGPITDFPIQEVQQAMFTLQNILLPDQLSSFELSEGVIKIQGTSSEPQAILQRLEQDPMFTEVVFSRATNNSRYYIDLRLSTVNFEGYMVRYFPED